MRVTQYPFRCEVYLKGGYLLRKQGCFQEKTAFLRGGPGTRQPGDDSRRFRAGWLGGICGATLPHHKVKGGKKKENGEGLFFSREKGVGLEKKEKNSKVSHEGIERSWPKWGGRMNHPSGRTKEIVKGA